MVMDMILITECDNLDYYTGNVWSVPLNECKACIIVIAKKI